MKGILLFIAVAVSSAWGASKPNVIFILCDDLGYADVGFHHSPDIKTPNLDYLSRPFEPIPTLASHAEYMTKMLAVYHRCGTPAGYTHRIVRSDELVVLGATDAYEARCRLCYDPTEPEQPKLIE